MKTSLDHLSERKRRDLARVVEIVFSEFETAIARGTMPHTRQGRILKIILFGSYARGEWVHNRRRGGYVSDYDVLVVVNHEKLTDPIDYWEIAEERLVRDYSVHRRLSAPVSLIFHSLADVNEQLRCGRYFFIDILREGIALYEAPGHPFVQPTPLSPSEALKEAQAFFESWFSSAGGFLSSAAFSMSDHQPKVAAFLLHQATERLYHCVLLTFTLYSPASHNLNFLRPRAEQADARLSEAWPRATKRDRRRFELIRRAYVEARYSPHYTITLEELGWAIEQVTALHALVGLVCAERLAAPQPDAQAG